MVSLEQLSSLLDFMKEHPDLAKGLSRGRRGKLMSIKVWNSCAKRLNAVKQGAVKDGKGWSKVPIYLHTPLQFWDNYPKAHHTQ